MEQKFEVAKPPIGAKPRMIFIDERIGDLIGALQRGFHHLGTDETMPATAIQWAEELVDRLRERSLKGKIRIEHGGDS